MKKKLYLFVVLALFQFLSVSFFCVEAKNDEQPITCAWPSEMMSNYFEFQAEMKAVLLWTELNSQRFSASFGTGWLFTNRVLEFSSNSAINLLSSRVFWNIKSFFSNSVTSLSLLGLATFSVVQSNVEGLAILFADWPIVRDYKTMLDIETDLFDIAYFRSKEINILQDIDSNMEKKLKNVIKKYIDKWLFVGNDSVINWSIRSILWELNRMNSVMKQFIMVWGKSIWNAWLRKYRWCFWTVGVWQCTDKVAIVMFSGGAVDQLYDDYKDVRWPFWGCNANWNNIKSNLKKTIKNNSDIVSNAVQDMGDALDRLWYVLNEDIPEESYDPCKSLSEYEMAQLQAYWWWNWSCGDWITLNDPMKYFKDKWARAKQKRKRTDTPRYSVDSVGKKKMDDKMIKARSYQERAEYYASQMDKWDLSQYYNFDLEEDVFADMNMTINEFLQSQENASAADVIGLFWKIRGVLNQLDSVISNSEDLKKRLKGVESSQCN